MNKLLETIEPKLFPKLNYSKRELDYLKQSLPIEFDRLQKLKLDVFNNQSQHMYDNRWFPSPKEKLYNELERIELPEGPVPITKLIAILKKYISSGDQDVYIEFSEVGDDDTAMVVVSIYNYIDDPNYDYNAAIYNAGIAKYNKFSSANNADVDEAEALIKLFDKRIGELYA